MGFYVVNGSMLRHFRNATTLKIHTEISVPTYTTDTLEKNAKAM